MSDMQKVYISVGSNISPESNIRASMGDLGKLFGALEVSPVYRSKAQGFEGDDFLNLAVSGKTSLGPTEVVAALKELEEKFGRDHQAARFSARTLDLDLLLYGNEVVSEGGLDIPRPELEEYAHVLVPLVDLAPEQRHPLSGRLLTEMYRDLQQRAPKQFSGLREVAFQL
jgi:2-amino-4-hydroxy-6-hydroxymethyldihydropteridine diphosphokinase